MSNIVSHYIDLAETNHDIRSIIARMDFINRKPCPSADCKCEDCEEFEALKPDLIMLRDQRKKINQSIKDEVEDSSTITNR